MKSLTLISVIGKPGSGRYLAAKYNLNGQIYDTDFFFLPLLKHYQPHHFYLLGTKDSIWGAVEESRSREHFTYERVEIPFGISPEEIWQIFERIVTLRLKDTRVIIDITHGFRAIPIAVLLAAFYFQTVAENIVIEDIVYGNLEARNPDTGVAPVVHLNSYLDMIDWIRAAARFNKYGDGDLLIEKLEPYNTEQQFSAFLQSFRDFVDALRLNYVSQITPSVTKLVSHYKGQNRKELIKIAPFKLLEASIRERLDLLLKDEPEWKKQWRVAEWFFASRQYSQAILVLKEVLFTFVCEIMGVSIMSRKVREQVAGKITFLLQNSVEEIRKKFNFTPAHKQLSTLQEIAETIGSSLLERWAILLDEVSEARNRAGHALMRGGEQKEAAVKPGEQILKLKQWLQETEQVLTAIESLPKKKRNRLIALLDNLKARPSRVYLIVNEGVHPIVPALKRQYGKDIEYEEITRGNTDLDQEKAIALRVKEIVGKYPGAEFVLVPSGLPYILTVAYNTIFQITSRHPVYLQLDRVNDRYIEKVLDPRELIL